MSATSDNIASETKNCSFSLPSIQKFLVLMATQQTVYSDISYKANGPFALVLRAKKCRIAEVALKVLECTDHTACQIQAMEKEYAIRKQLPSSDYFMAIQNQFFLTEIDQSGEQGQSENPNTAKKIYFVQEMEMCQGSLHDAFQHYSENNLSPPSEAFKELLAIQMFDALNLLHQKNIVHENITAQHFLVSSSQNYPVLLKLCNLCFTSPVYLKNPDNSVSANEFQNRMADKSEIQSGCSDQDLLSLGKVLLQLDNIGTNFDYSIISKVVLSQPDLTTIFETHQLNTSTLLYKIACSLLNKSGKNSQSVRSMLLLLLQKQIGPLNTPLFSVVLKTQLDSLLLPIPSKRIMLDSLVWQVRRQYKLHNISSWFNNKGQRKTQLTENLLKSSLSILLEWKEISEVYDVLGVGVGGVVFGVENLKEQRKSALKLSLCTNKAETLKEIGIRRICQGPCIVRFYQCKFFKDANGNEFVVQELERCKYSLTHHLELQRIYGEYSDEQKNRMTNQIIDSVNFLHENKILHRNIKLDSFLITENESGQAVVKLGNFSHAVQLQDNFQVISTTTKQPRNKEQMPVNCILQKHNRESPLYFAPERWEYPDLSTYLTDSFSVGMCIFLLDNWLICSEEQLARKLLLLPLRATDIYLEMVPPIDKKAMFKKIAKEILMFYPQQRQSLRNLNGKKFTSTQKQSKGNAQALDENIFQESMILTLEDHKVLDDFTQTPMKFAHLKRSCLNFNSITIGDTKTNSLLNVIRNLLNLEKSTLLFPLSNLLNLSSLTLNLNNNNIEDIIVKSLLTPLKNLINLSSLSLNLQNNQIGDTGAQSLLYPLAKLLNLSDIALNLDSNRIGHLGAQSLLSPLSNLLNLSSLSLNLDKNNIGHIGAQSLLCPLSNLLNLSNIILNLQFNLIGDIGTQSLLSPLENLINLSNLTLFLKNNLIEDLGVQLLLCPLANLLNLLNITLNIENNRIGDIGAQSLFCPLANLLNLQSLTLNISNNQIADKGALGLLSPLANLLNLSSISLNFENNNIGAQSLLSPLANLLNLSIISLNLDCNKIGDKGAQLLLSPLSNLINLSSLSLSLQCTQIGDIGAQSLLCSIENLVNLSNLYLDLRWDKIRDIGTFLIFYPLSNLICLSSLDLQLSKNPTTKQTEHLFNHFFNKKKSVNQID